MICSSAIGFINSTVLVATGNNIVVSNQPLPICRHGQKVLYHVNEVYYKKELSDTRADFGWVYTFLANTDSEQDIRILGTVDRQEDAIKINEAIQKQVARGRSVPKQNSEKDVDNRSYIDKLRGYHR